MVATASGFDEIWSAQDLGPKLRAISSEFVTPKNRSLWQETIPKLTYLQFPCSDILNAHKHALIGVFQMGVQLRQRLHIDKETMVCD